MDEFLTDEQEAERARQWLRENGLFILAGVVLGLGGLFGWQQWESSKLSEAGDITPSCGNNDESDSLPLVSVSVWQVIAEHAAN